MEPNTILVYKDPHFKGPKEVEGKFEDSADIGTYSLTKSTGIGRNTTWKNCASTSRKSGAKCSI